MPNHPKDIYTEPTPDADTLANLGPLAPMAGIWTSAQGLDVNPKADGPERQPYIERIELQPIDAQTNGPQLFYGLRYHTHILKPDEAETLHDQVGYWLWEPATGLIMQSLTIPRGQIVLAAGHARPDDMKISVSATRGDPRYGICSTEFLDEAFRTTNYKCGITFNADDSWTYAIETDLIVHGKPFNHHDTNTLKRVAPPALNPLAVLEKKGG